jgi:hypothetical protein
VGDTKAIEIRPELADAVRYLERQADAVKFGKIGLSITVHGGRIKQIERSTLESFIPKK